MHSTNHLPFSSIDAYVNVYVRESVGREREDTTTILGLLLLRGAMDGVVDARRRTSRTSTILKERLGLKGFGCCGATWGFRPTTISVRDDDDDDYEGDRPLAPLPLDEDQEVIGIDVGHDQEAPSGRVSDTGCLELGPAPIPASSRMNLAAALAAERQFREVNSVSARATVNSNGVATEVSPTPEPGKPWRVSLMRLLEDTDGGHGGLGTSDNKAGEEEEDEEKADGDQVCCVCMGRKKGAAFIPCGHTFCRVCSREIWLNRGSCPLCNRSILDVLDIF